MHSVSLSQPPFAFLHSSMSSHLPDFAVLNPSGQLPHLYPPTVLMHSTLASHPPLFTAHSSTSAHVMP